ncbi:hypothetical protein [Streptomyces bottropensis]|uniref:hypothetical protein n=1 Tax=Streptomyces bottropensis TaxID=42235 RepID=UPI003689AF76
MPRSRPGRVRAGTAPLRTAEARSDIDGLSSRARAEILLLERTRNYLRPGDVGAAVRLWRDYVQRPERQHWADHESGNEDWDCCGDPLEARALLATVMRAMSPRNARELRQAVGRSDAVWCRSSPPYDLGNQSIS